MAAECAGICVAPTRSFHLVTKPATGGAPIMLSEATAKAAKVKGMVRPRPAMSLMFFLCAAT